MVIRVKRWFQMVQCKYLFWLRDSFILDSWPIDSSSFFTLTSPCSQDLSCGGQGGVGVVGRKGVEAILPLESKVIAWLIYLLAHMNKPVVFFPQNLRCTITKIAHSFSHYEAHALLKRNWKATFYCWNVIFFIFLHRGKRAILILIKLSSCIQCTN